MALTIADLRTLIDTPSPPELGPGVRNGVAPPDGLSRALQALFSQASLPQNSQELVRALVFLWHDHHDAAHSIAQDIANVDGSYVHGIIHRREPDYSNARYWFQRVGQHACFPELVKRVASAPAGAASDLLHSLTASGKWNAIAFVDACEKFSGKSGKEAGLLRQIQAIELELLLQHFAGAR